MDPFLSSQLKGTDNVNNDIFSIPSLARRARNMYMFKDLSVTSVPMASRLWFSKTVKKNISDLLKEWREPACIVL